MACALYQKSILDQSVVSSCFATHRRLVSLRTSWHHHSLAGLYRLHSPVLVFEPPAISSDLPPPTLRHRTQQLCPFEAQRLILSPLQVYLRPIARYSRVSRYFASYWICSSHFPPHICSSYSRTPPPNPCSTISRAQGYIYFACRGYRLNNSPRSHPSPQGDPT